jgi:hypothetical protein
MIDLIVIGGVIAVAVAATLHLENAARIAKELKELEETGDLIVMKGSEDVER